jgi:hypothetical protein
MILIIIKKQLKLNGRDQDTLLLIGAVKIMNAGLLRTGNYKIIYANMSWQLGAVKDSIRNVFAGKWSEPFVSSCRF